MPHQHSPSTQAMPTTSWQSSAHAHLPQATQDSTLCLHLSWQNQDKHTVHLPPIVPASWHGPQNINGHPAHAVLLGTIRRQQWHTPNMRCCALIQFPPTVAWSTPSLRLVQLALSATTSERVKYWDTAPSTSNGRQDSSSGGSRAGGSGGSSGGGSSGSAFGGPGYAWREE